jgi:hypothetical protein
MIDFSTPDTFRPGVIDRDVTYGDGEFARAMPYGTIPESPRFRDVFSTIPENEWLDIIRSQHAPNSDELIWNVYDQGPVGSCAPEALNKGAETKNEGAGRKRTKLNPYGMYYTTSGGRDQGSSLASNVAFAKRYGCFPEEVWPRSKGWRTKPSEAAYEAASHHKLDETLDINNTSASAFYAELISGMLMDDAPFGYVGYPGHAIGLVAIVEATRTSAPHIVAAADAVDSQIVRRIGVRAFRALTGDTGLPRGLADTLYARYINSWHESWGDRGRGYIRLTSLQRGYGAWVFRTNKESTR